MTSGSEPALKDVGPAGIDRVTGVPPGFAPYVSTSPFIAHLGRMYQREAENGIVVIGLSIATQHTNLHRNAHGGMLSALIDNALGYNISRVRKEPVVTAHLSIDYLEAIQYRDWVEAHVSIRKLGSRLCFADCVLMIGTHVAVRASGILAVIKASS